MAAAQLSAVDVDADSGTAADGVDCAKGVEGGGGESEERSSQSLAKALHDEVMADVEVVLKRKEDMLWSRGRVELQSLREERAQVVSTLGDISARQDQLLHEHSQMRGTLMDITARLEHLAREMRDSLRVGPQQAVGAGDGLDAFGGFADGYDLVDAGAMAQFIAADAAAMADGPRTPSRPPVGGSSTSSTQPFSMLAPPLPGSPAVRLSLASALDASQTTPPSQQSAKRLAIAECLNLDGPSGSSRKASGEAVVASTWQPAVGPDFATDSPPSLHAGSTSWQLEQSPVLDQAAGSQLRSLRAEAPAFVPGAGFVTTDNNSASGGVDAPSAASPVGLRLEPPPAQVGNEEVLGDPSSP